MKGKALLLLLFLLIETWPAGGAALPAVAPASAAGPAQQNLLTVRLNLMGQPATLDPALCTPSNQYQNVVGQLFVGLTATDDTSGAVVPELASAWQVSADHTVYTFTLRPDARWSDGRPLSAYDVEYGVRRSVRPETRANWGHVLYIIQNAYTINVTPAPTETYDIETLGVHALDLHMVRFDLERPASYFPAVLSMAPAFPQPRWAIEAHGAAWIEPAHIVSSGPYLLDEWQHNDHLTLVKNPAFYGAGGVQIEQVEIIILYDFLSLGMYETGELDTALVSDDDLYYIRNDPLLSQELRFVPNSCTYYYGFTTPKPPLDDVRVRQALSLAIDRHGLVENVLSDAQIPAQAFTPPGIFGNAAGEAGVGLGFDPERARELFAQAGYTDGVGFPDIILMHNTSEGHARIAQAVQQMWLEVLGFEAAIENLEWAVYMQLLLPDTPLEEMPHVWRMGWCQDYPDAHNFLYEVFHAAEAINRSRLDPADPLVAQFDALLERAGQQVLDPDQRQALYRQAEDLLHDDLAALASVYYYADPWLSKPYLQRTFPQSDVPFHVARWRVRGSDLSVAQADLWTEPLSPHAGYTVTVGANIYNGGGVALHDVEVAFYDGDPDAGGLPISGTITLPTVPARGMATASIEAAWTPSEGLHALHVLVDPAGLLPETAAQNNAAHRQVLVLPAGADATPPSGTLAIAGGVLSTTRRMVRLDVPASDDSGSVEQVFLRELGTGPGPGEWRVEQESGWLSYTTPLTWTLLPNGGTKLLLAWFADAGGNVSPPARAAVQYLPLRSDLPTGDWHLYRWPLAAGQGLSLTLETTTLEGDADLYVWRPGNAGPPDWFSSAPGQARELIPFTAPISGQYQIQVYAHEGAKYHLDITPLGNLQAGSGPLTSLQQKQAPTMPLTMADLVDPGVLPGGPPPPPGHVPPQLVAARPAAGEAMVLPWTPIELVFSKALSPTTLLYACQPDPGGWVEAWERADTEVSLRHSPFLAGQTYTVTLSGGGDSQGHPLDGLPHVWSFKTGWPIYIPLILLGWP